MVALKKGKEVNGDGIINEMTSDDVVIKGANALDSGGIAGVMLANPIGGTTGNNHWDGHGKRNKSYHPYRS